VSRLTECRERKTHGENSPGVDEGPACSTTWTIGKPTPNESHHNEYASRRKRNYNCKRQSTLSKSRVGSLTVVDLRYRERDSGKGSRFLVETLQPVAHGKLWSAVIPDDIQQGKKIGVPAQQDSLRLSFRPRLFTSPPNCFHASHREDVLCFGGPPRLLAALRQIGKESEA
jgi:hypothetical protein